MVDVHRLSRNAIGRHGVIEALGTLGVAIRTLDDKAAG